MNIVNKKEIKQGYYYEYKNIYDTLPDTLQVTVYQTEILTKSMSNKEVIDEYKIYPFTVEQAFAVAIDCIETLKNDFKTRVIYFKNNDNVYRLHVYRRDDSQLCVYVYMSEFGYRWDAGDSTLFSTTAIPLDYSSLYSLTLEKSIQIIKNAGYKIIKEM